VALAQVLQRAQAPVARVIATQEAQKRRQQERENTRLAELTAKREALLADAGYARRVITEQRTFLDDYVANLSQPGRDTFALLLASRGPLELAEEQTLERLAEHLQDTLIAGSTPPPAPSDAVRAAIKRLLDSYRKEHQRIVQEAAESFGSGPTLDRARARLAKGRPLPAEELDSLEDEARRDRDAARIEHKRQAGYLAQHHLIAAERLRQSGTLGRFKHQPEDFHGEIDAELLRRCSRCHRVIYPPPISEKPACLFCRDTPHHVKQYSPCDQAQEPA
jgi:hypothetical protein